MWGCRFLITLCRAQFSDFGPRKWKTIWLQFQNDIVIVINLCFYIWCLSPFILIDSTLYYTTLHLLAIAWYHMDQLGAWGHMRLRVGAWRQVWLKLGFDDRFGWHGCLPANATKSGSLMTGVVEIGFWQQIWMNWVFDDTCDLKWVLEDRCGWNWSLTTDLDQLGVWGRTHETKIGCLTTGVAEIGYLPIDMTDIWEDRFGWIGCLTKHATKLGVWRQILLKWVFDKRVGWVGCLTTHATEVGWLTIYSAELGVWRQMRLKLTAVAETGCLVTNMIYIGCDDKFGWYWEQIWLSAAADYWMLNWKCIHRISSVPASLRC